MLFYLVLAAAICVASTDASEFTTSLQVLLRGNGATDVTSWQGRNAEVHSIHPVFTATYEDYQAVGATLLNEAGEPVGETYVLRDNLHPERLVNLNLDTSGRGYVVTANAAGLDEEVIYEIPMVDPNLPRCSVKDHGEDEAGVTHEITQGETDTDGSYEIDVLPIFSTAAAVVVQQMGLSLPEYLYLQKAMVETAWSNSDISGVKLRMLPHSLWEKDLAVTDANAKWLRSHARAEQALVGADLVAFFTTGSHKGPSIASGYGGVKDFYTLQQVNDLTAWRHEVGHNAGLEHCSTAEEAGNIDGTIMCRNSVAFYSNPETKVTDAARQWNEYKAPLSGIKSGLVPRADETPTYTVSETLTFDTADGGDYNWTVSDDVNKMVFTAASEDESPFVAFLDSACCLGVYWGHHEASATHTLVLEEPHAGPWYVRLTGTGPTDITIDLYSA